MKTMKKLPIVVCSILLLQACGESNAEYSERMIAEETSLLEAEKEATQSKSVPLNLKDPSSLVGHRTIRDLFSLPEEIVIREESRTGRYAYMWTFNKIDYDLEAGFWQPESLNEEQAKEQYKALTTSPTDQKMNPQQVDLGDQAQFSETAGGHLTVRIKNEILDLYLSGKLSPLEDPQIPYTKFSKEQTKSMLMEIGKHIITRMK